jgi:hypothetical protein
MAREDRPSADGEDVASKGPQPSLTAGRDTSCQNLESLLAGIASHGEALPPKFKAALDPRRNAPERSHSMLLPSPVWPSKGPDDRSVGVGMPSTGGAESGFVSLIETAPWAVRTAWRHAKPLSVSHAKTVMVAGVAITPPGVDAPLAASADTAPIESHGTAGAVGAPETSLQALLESQPWSRRPIPKPSHADRASGLEDNDTVPPAPTADRRLPSLKEFIWQKVAAEAAIAEAKSDDRQTGLEAADEGAGIGAGNPDAFQLAAAVPESTQPDTNHHSTLPTGATISLPPDAVPVFEEKKTLNSASEPSFQMEPASAFQAMDDASMAEGPSEDATIPNLSSDHLSGPVAEPSPASDVSEASESSAEPIRRLPALLMATETASSTPIPAKRIPIRSPAKPKKGPLPGATRREIPVEDLLGGVFSLIVSGFRGAAPAIKKAQESSASGISIMGRGVRQLTEKIGIS